MFLKLKKVIYTESFSIHYILNEDSIFLQKALSEKTFLTFLPEAVSYCK